MSVTMTDEMVGFLNEWAELGGPVARANNLPVSAMLACASIESGWGKGRIFRATLNPFSLQKWPHVIYPKTHRTHWSSTQISTNPPRWAKAPFNCAIDQADAVRQWCEWIFHYGAADGPPGNQNPKAPQVAEPHSVTRRIKLLGFTGKPVEFTRNLPLVGFGEGEASGAAYAKRLIDFSLQSFD